jgi:GT2 family glycosyltransferase
VSDRPTVSVVMPFAGDATAVRAALDALTMLGTRPGDQLILADNSDIAPEHPDVTVVRALGERSPAFARNVGAAHARGDWILFLDADCRPLPGLLDAYFSEPIGDAVGALAGEVTPAPEGATLAERYGAARSFLGQRAHLAHPYQPRAVAANLLVRRAAFEAVGGFYEGVRAGEDTDFSWRLQQVGWRLELREAAAVEHRYRATLRELRAQWRGYAAGRAWLARRYPGFAPEPAAARGIRRAVAAVRRRGARREKPQRVGSTPAPRRIDRYLPLDVLLAIEELTGFALSNRPRNHLGRERSGAVVLVADRFPAHGDPLVDFARTLDHARVEATSRPPQPWLEMARELEIFYREDEGALSRLLALARLVTRHPLRCARDRLRRGPGEPTLRALAPAALRLERHQGARIQALGGAEARVVARRLASLTRSGVRG